MNRIHLKENKKYQIWFDDGNYITGYIKRDNIRTAILYDCYMENVKGEFLFDYKDYRIDKNNISTIFYKDQLIYDKKEGVI